jgi:uncharacterized protein (DUF488 family)
VDSIGERARRRRAANSKALAAFERTPAAAGSDAAIRCVREGGSIAVFTVGYEARDGEDLVARLRDCGVDLLVDVRERPFSRKPDFRRKALQALCEANGISYSSWTSLGSTLSQREKLKEDGDFATFRKRFRELLIRCHERSEEIARLTETASEQSIALLCYERCHDECHRSVIADLVADRIDASVFAIL